MKDLVARRRVWAGAAIGVAAVALGAFSAPARAQTADGYDVIFDGTAESFAKWQYTGLSSITLQPDGTLRTVPSRVSFGLGLLWYPVKSFADFSLRLQWRDDSPMTNRRANSGVHLRFPAPLPPVAGCPTTFNGMELNNAAWVAHSCGHEMQINDSANGGGNDPRKTGSIYGFKDLTLAQAMPQPIGFWNDLEIRVVRQHYTVIRNGVVINEYENLPGVPFPGRPLDPDSSSRGLVGYIGLQAHDQAQDVVSFRDVKVRSLFAPVAAGKPTITGKATRGESLTGQNAAWSGSAATFTYAWLRDGQPIQGATSTTYTVVNDDVGHALAFRVTAVNEVDSVAAVSAAVTPNAETVATGSVGGAVGATLSLAMGAPASFGAFTPGIARDYDAVTTATVVSTAGDATLSVADPSATATGRLVNGTFALPQAVQVRATSAFAPVGGSSAPTPLLSFTNPVSNALATLTFRQAIGASDALRTGSYSKTLTFTLSTTTP